MPPQHTQLFCIFFENQFFGKFMLFAYRTVFYTGQYNSAINKK